MVRAKNKNSQISVHAVAGTSVVLLGFDVVTKQARKELLGFAVQRTGSGGEKWLRGGRVFEGQSLKDRPDSRQAPIQAFTWSDFTADPGKTYSYVVYPVYGTPEAPKPSKGLKVTVTTEQPDDGIHGIYFNRAVAGSQSYSRRFGDAKRYYPSVGKDRDGNPKTWWPAYIKPEDVTQGDAWGWLSRGLDKAMLKFIGQARGKKYGLRAAVYEFNYKPALQAFSDALERGADVKIVHHAKRESDLKLVRETGSVITLTDRDGKVKQQKNKALKRVAVKDSVTRATQHAIADVGIKKYKSGKAREEMMIERINTGAISHNKFIVLLEDGKPTQVWTGSTNYTTGGIFGQSNVGHVIRDETVAKAYLAYWQALSEDPKKKDMQQRTVTIQPDIPDGKPRKGVTPIFSPRPDLAMLHWYGDRLRAATQSVHLTAAFGVGGLKDFFKTRGGGRVRYILMESLRGAAKASYNVIKDCDQNRIAWGDTRKRSADGDDEHLVEALTGLNEHVSYIHTKYMLIDALTSDPIVITGSANFSDPSTRTNDENMVVIRGNTRVADIYVTEFMRFFKHFQYRNEERARDGVDLPLAGDESWMDAAFKQGTPEYDERLLYR